MKTMGWLRWLLLVWVAAAWACTRPSLSVEERSSKGWQSVSYSLHSVDGKRDGYLTRSTVELANGYGEHLKLMLVVSVNPTARMERGEWSYAGPDGKRAGVVLPIHLEFLGGQGAGPSIGGRFLLQEEGKPVYRVHLPATPVAGGYN